jgi:type VI secretion system ImpM family protein
MSGALGFYGKLPGAGDFVGRRLPSGFVDIWDRHFEQAIDTARTALSAQWTAAYRDGPAWRFVLPAHVCGESAWCGLIGPAEDRVGRGFPLVLAAPCSGGCAGLFADGDWFDALERVFVGAQYEALGVEAFDARVAALPPPCAHANDARPWWRDLDWDSAQWRLPSPQDVAAGLLLDAAWQQLATRPGSWCLWWTRRAERVLATRGLPGSYASLLEPRDEQDLAALLEPGGAQDIASLLEPGGAQEYASQPELRAAQRHASQPESRGMHDHASPPDVRGPRPAATSPTLPASTGDRHDSSNPLGTAASPSDPNAPTVSRVSARLGDGREHVEWPSAHSARDLAATTVRDATHGDVSRGRTGAQTSGRPNASSSVQPGALPELSASLADAALLSLDHGRTLLVSADDGPPDPRRRAAQRIRAAALASAPDLANLRATLLALHAPLRAAAEDALNPVHEEGAALAARFEAGRIHLLRIGTAAAWHWRHGVLTPLFVERAAGVGGELDDLLFGDAWLAMPGLGSMTGPHCDETGAAFEPGDRLLLVATRNLTQLAPEVFAEALGLPSCEDARMHIAARVGLHATPATSAMAALSARSAISATPAQWPLAIIEERA